MSRMKCIYHYMHPIENNGVGSGVRPYKMLKAFENIGYEVENISGYGCERKRKAKELINKIKNGEQYEFMYSESLTEPNLLAEKNHFPSHPLIDIELFKCCHKYSIPIGLFYRDIHWKYELYKKNVAFYKRCIAIPLYKLDLFIYNNYLSILFCPTQEFADRLNVTVKKLVLPPGCTPDFSIKKYREKEGKKDKKLSILYVGSVLGPYNIRKIIEAVLLCEDVFLTICTPEDQWLKKKSEFDSIMCDRISIVHKRSAELKEYYKNADVSICCIEPDPYHSIASPLKCKETIGYSTPIIISNNISVADEIEKEGYGWKVNNNVDDLVKLFDFLCNNPYEIQEKTRGAIAAIQSNTWESRAKFAANSLTYYKP